MGGGSTKHEHRSVSRVGEGALPYSLAGLEEAERELRAVTPPGHVPHLQDCVVQLLFRKHPWHL